MPTFDPAGYMTEAFIAAHGGNPVRTGPCGVTLLPDGAWLSGNEYVLNDPPRDPLQRAKKRRAYHTARYNRTKEDRRHLAFALEGGPPFKWPINRYSPYTNDGTAALALLDKIIGEDREAIAALDVEIGPTLYA